MERVMPSNPTSPALINTSLLGARLRHPTNIACSSMAWRLVEVLSILGSGFQLHYVPPAHHKLWDNTGKSVFGWSNVTPLVSREC